MGLIHDQEQMRLESENAGVSKSRQDILEFEPFYNTSYYKKFKEGIEAKLDELDRAPITDPSTLVLIQGQRNAYIAILDDLRKKERKVNALKRSSM